MSKSTETAAKKPEPKVFAYGDLAIVCKCGHTTILGKGIEHGVQFTITTREDSFINLACRECGAELKLCFLEGVKPEEPVTESEEKVNEDVQEENKQEQSL